MSNNYMFSVIGAYNYDNTVFDGLELPTDFFTKGYENLFTNFVAPDKELLISHILIECGQLSLTHTDTDFLKEEIRIWSKVHSIDWRQMYETIFYKYNPIWNKDGVFNETETQTGNGTTRNVRTISGTDSDEYGGEDETNRSNTDDSTTINSVNAFDSGSPTEHDRTKYDGEFGENVTNTYGKTRTGEHAETVSDSGTNSDNRNLENARVEQGNIGVTMTQEMIERQRDVIMNFYDYIVGQFKERFCILIW